MITYRKGKWAVEIHGQFFEPMTEEDSAIVRMVATE